jgi:protein-tyrosine phosphatase
MIDIHLHLLPGVDDGPPDMSASLALAQALVEANMRRAVITPHIDDWTAHVLPDPAAVASHTAVLEAALAQAGIPLSIVPGGECFLTPELIERVKQRQVPTWGHGPCLLVEMVTSQRLLHVDRMLGQLVLSGLHIVLAHPERYSFVQENPQVLDDLVDGGLLLQVTAGVFGAERGRQSDTARALLARGKIHLLASDAHNPRGVQSMLLGVQRVRELVGDEAVRTLYEHNPMALLDGDRAIISLPPMSAPARHSFRFPFFRQR